MMILIANMLIATLVTGSILPGGVPRSEQHPATNHHSSTRKDAAIQALKESLMRSISDSKKLIGELELARSRAESRGDAEFAARLRRYEEQERLLLDGLLRILSRVEHLP